MRGGAGLIPGALKTELGILAYFHNANISFDQKRDKLGKNLNNMR